MHLHPLKSPLFLAVLFAGAGIFHWMTHMTYFIVVSSWFARSLDHLVSQHQKEKKRNLGEMCAFQCRAIADRKMHACVPARLPVIGCSHMHVQRPPVAAADRVFSFLFLHRETTSGVHSWSFLLRPRSTTGTRSSPALCPNSRWESTAPAEWVCRWKHLQKTRLQDLMSTVLFNCFHSSLLCCSCEKSC